MRVRLLRGWYFLRELVGRPRRLSGEEFHRAGQTTLLAGSPWIFGKAKTHSPMRSTKVMKLEKGAWVVETPDFVVLPEVN